MTNKQQINKLKDNAELAWASYGYFHYFLERHNKPDYIDKVHYIDAKDKNGKYKLDNNNKKVKKPIEITDILDVNYKKCDVFEYNSFLKRYEKIGTLKGEFTTKQAKRFFEKYKLLNHQPNTSSGFSATLFQNKESKEYILAFRGTELSNIGDIGADFRLAFSGIAKNQYFDMIKFYDDCIQKGCITKSTSLTITGHSLGGALAQLFALSFADDSNKKSIINEVYTFNAPGAKDLNPFSDSKYKNHKAYQTLTHNYENRNKKDYRLSISDRVFHIETQDKTYKENHAEESYIKNAIQHLHRDIDGNYFILNLNFGGLKSHSISSVINVLYFYSYLYEVNEALIDKVSKDVKTEYDLNRNKFLKEHSEVDTPAYKEFKRALEYCNRITLAVYNILLQREKEKAVVEAMEKYYLEYLNKVENLSVNWLYAIIERRLNELQIKKQEKNMELPFKFEKNDTSNIIEAILYLQDNDVYIHILEKDLIEGLKVAEALLAYAFAIHETSFFVGADKDLNPIIQDSDRDNVASHFGYNESKVIAFCNPKRTMDEKLFECYKEETLALYPNVG